ncbi:ATP-binding response regulator [Pseudonocardia humida]|uniref:histidine kinase n=1 Tax=Pseudonocardia humida TaxID=2800819 RepID=A0ABT0ZXT2_9PSEU|nr:ATP-binding protein [Pseudonocardia humida]MCO1655552.1 response regulator [Pseudonocardia humida]
MTGPAEHEVLRLQLVEERDVFVARQRGREVAAAVGLENQDQVRVATAVSELGRELVLRGRRTEIVLSLAGGIVPALLVTARWAGELPGLELTEGVRSAGRLADRCEVTQSAGGGTAVLGKRLPAGTDPGRPGVIEGLRERFRGTTTSSALEELRVQNQELLSTLEVLQARQEALEEANAELEETNRGVLALHAELSGELDETNRGVVALYAELDEKSDQLREASESKTRFWANVSHELRTPINSVVGLAKLLLDPRSEPLTGEQRTQVEMIRDSGAVLLALVNELLDVAKAESGRMEPQWAPVDVGGQLQHLRATLLPLTPPGVALEVAVPERTPPVSTDPGMLTAIVRNLATNALKFTTSGEVRITAAFDPGAGLLRVAVSDTGIGIPADQLGRVFEEFHQVPGPLQVGAAGTGLGLPLARRLAEILGGSLALSSEVGVGTTATLQLPVSGPATAVARLGRVLVVDDDPAFRALVRRALHGVAERVDEAGDGATTVRLLHAEPPDLLVLDLHIPPPDGRAVLAGMRADPVLAALPVVVVTSADLDPAWTAEMAASAVVLSKANLTAAVLLTAAADAARLVGGTDG